MISTLAIAGYRSLRDVRIGLDALNVVTGANGSGKSSLYRALGLPPPVPPSAFLGDPEIKVESLWTGPLLGRANGFAARAGHSLNRGTP